MRTERNRLRRLQRLAQVHAIARETAAREACEAESTLAQLATLAERTRRMSQDYAARPGLSAGHELHRLNGFTAGLDAIRVSTQAEAERARQLADARQHDLAIAERRRAAVQDRADQAARAIAGQRVEPALDPRRAVGTACE